MYKSFFEQKYKIEYTKHKNKKCTKVFWNKNIK